MRDLTLFLTVGWLLILVGLAPANLAAQGCEYDTQCKGDRVCEKGQCVAPTGSAGKGAESGGQKTEPKTDSMNLPRYCCTLAGKLGPYPNPDETTGKAIPEGRSCYGTTTTGQIALGQVCY